MISIIAIKITVSEGTQIVTDIAGKRKKIFKCLVLNLSLKEVKVIIERKLYLKRTMLIATSI